MKTMQRARGFSLIELLVVIAIIGLLAGLLIPVLKVAQDKAKRVHCANNIQQFGRALAMYAMDNDERYPSNLVALAKTGYADDPGLFRCKGDPARYEALNTAQITEEDANKYCSYLLITKEINGAAPGSSSSPTMLIVMDKNGVSNTVTDTQFGGNHQNRGGNILRCDGAVKWVSTEKWSSNLWGNADLSSAVGY